MRLHINKACLALFFPIHCLTSHKIIMLSYSTVVSYSTIVLYSRDHKGVGVAHRITSLKHQPQFSLTMMRQYWLGKTNPKQVFRST